MYQECNLNCTAIARSANTHLCELCCNCCSKLQPALGCLVGASKVDAPKGGLGFICFASPSCVLVLCSDRCVVIDRLCDVLYVSSRQ